MNYLDVGNKIDAVLWAAVMTDNACDDEMKAIIQRILEKNAPLFARLAGTGPVCNICHRALDSPYDDLGAKDCAGTCQRCMAEAGDPTCQAAMDAAGLPYDPYSLPEGFSACWRRETACMSKAVSTKLVN